MKDGKYYVSLIGQAAQKAVPISAHDEAQLSMVGVLVPAVALGVVGALVWKQHRVLGALGGFAVGGSVYPIAKGQYVRGVEGLVPTAVGIGLSLKWKKHPAWGFVLGSLGAGFALAAVDIGVGLGKATKAAPKALPPPTATVVGEPDPFASIVGEMQ